MTADQKSEESIGSSKHNWLDEKNRGGLDLLTRERKIRFSVKENTHSLGILSTSAILPLLIFLFIFTLVPSLYLIPSQAFYGT